MRLAALVACWLALSSWAGAEVPLRVGHSGGFASELADFTRVYLGIAHGRDFHLSVVGPETEAATADDIRLLRATLAGDFQLAWVQAYAVTNFDRLWGFLSIPFLFPNADAERAWVQAGQLKEELTGRGLLALSVVESGPRLFVSEKPLQSLADLKGLRVRVPRDRFSRDFVEELGGIPVASGEAAVIETDERGRAAFQRTFPHELRSEHGLSYYVLIANEAYFARLSPQQQAILRGLDDGNVHAVGGRPPRLRPKWAWPVAEPSSSPSSLPADPRWRDRLKSLRERSLRLIGKPWSELFR